MDGATCPTTSSKEAADNSAHIPSSPKAWQRFYLGYQGRFVEDCTIHLCNGATVQIAQAPSAKTKAKNKQLSAAVDKQSDPALTGTTVWDGAIVLAQYLTSSTALQQHTYPSGKQKPVCLELGSGTGAVSLCLLAAGVVECAIITDIPDMLPHLALNVERNKQLIQPGTAHVHALRWSNISDTACLSPFKPPFDLIVGSDLVYYSYSEQTPHSKLLLQSLAQLANPDTAIYLSLSLHHNPEEVHQFLDWATEAGFTVRTVVDGIPKEYAVPDVMVVYMQRTG
eukprot:jgi/Chrzof1/13393/Cz07g31110.t1